MPRPCLSGRSRRLTQALAWCLLPAIICSEADAVGYVNATVHLKVIVERTSIMSVTQMKTISNQPWAQTGSSVICIRQSASAARSSYGISVASKNSVSGRQNFHLRDRSGNAAPYDLTFSIGGKPITVAQNTDLDIARVIDGACAQTPAAPMFIAKFMAKPPHPGGLYRDALTIFITSR